MANPPIDSQNPTPMGRVEGRHTGVKQWCGRVEKKILVCKKISKKTLRLYSGITFIYSEILQNIFWIFQRLSAGKKCIFQWGLIASSSLLSHLQDTASGETTANRCLLKCFGKKKVVSWEFMHSRNTSSWDLHSATPPPVLSLFQLLLPWKPLCASHWA